MFTYMFTCGHMLKPSTTLGAPWEDCIYDSHWEGALEVYQKIPEEALSGSHDFRKPWEGPVEARFYDMFMLLHTDLYNGIFMGY